MNMFRYSIEKNVPVGAQLESPARSFHL